MDIAVPIPLFARTEWVLILIDRSGRVAVCLQQPYKPIGMAMPIHCNSGYGYIGLSREEELITSERSGN